MVFSYICCCCFITQYINLKKENFPRQLLVNQGYMDFTQFHIYPYAGSWGTGAPWTGLSARYMEYIVYN